MLRDVIVVSYLHKPHFFRPHPIFFNFCIMSLLGADGTTKVKKINPEAVLYMERKTHIG
jgi:hypothetical protein